MSLYDYARQRLIVALLLVAAFAGGFYFDRWLHRPIVIQFNVGPSITT